MTRKMAGVLGMFTLAIVGAVFACVGDDAANGGGGPTADAGGGGVDAPPGADGSGGGTDATPEAATGCTDASDVTSDPANCGACGHACANGFGCTKSRCDSEVDDIAAGTFLACALLHGGKVWCWGETTQGGLGVAPSAADLACSSVKCRPAPGEVPGVTDAVKIAAGEHHACAVKSDGTLLCWGGNSNGQLAVSTATTSRPEPLPVALPVSTKVIDVTAQQNTTCALTAAGEVYCWGDNGTGQVGVAPSASVPTPNKVITAGASAVRISADRASGAHGCALVGNQMQCWGSNANGESGNSTGFANYPAPAVVKASAGGPDFVGVTSFGVGPGVSCALTNTGKTYCFGADTYAEIPPPNPAATRVYPAEVIGLPLDVKAIEVNAYTQYAVTQSGDVWAWGISLDGASGTGSEDGGAACGNLKFCTAAVEKSLLSNVARVSAGTVFAIALRRDGKVVAWGSNAYGALGHQTGTGSDAPCVGGESCTLTPTLVSGLP